MARFKLKLSKLDFVSLVDQPAQETATFRLLKRRPQGDKVQAIIKARIAKVGDGDSPLAYCWAFTCTDENGQPYHDLQGDAIGVDDFIKAAEEYMANGASVDQMHDSVQTNRIAFAYPMDPDIAKAMFGPAGGDIKTSGLMIAVRPTPEELVKIRNKEFTGVSIAGTGIRELVAKGAKGAGACRKCGADDIDKGAPCPSCGKSMGKGGKYCIACGKSAAPSDGAAKRSPEVAKAVWSTADIDNFPDSSFLYVEPGGTKDNDGKTTPRSLRHFPYRDASGAVDLPHLRDAIGRIPQSSLAPDLRDSLQVKAEKLLGDQHRVAKYSPDQPRDDHGRFDEGGGSISDQAHDSSTKARAEKTARAHSRAAALHYEAAYETGRRGDSAAATVHAELASKHAKSAGRIANASGTANDHFHALAAHSNAAQAASAMMQFAQRAGDAGARSKYFASSSYHAEQQSKHSRAEDAAESREAAAGAGGSRKRAAVAKQAVLTSVEDGHQHSLDLDDPAALRGRWPGDDCLATSAATSEGASTTHTHPWTYDPQTGDITIGEDSGHTHTTSAAVPADVLSEARLNDSGERCPSCGDMNEPGAHYCADCGAALHSNGAPKAAASDEDSGSGPAVVIVSARAPGGISTPAEPTATVKSQEQSMATDADKIKQLEADNARLAKMATLTDPQRAHYTKLTASDPSGAATFLAKSAPERDIVLADIEKANEVVYKSTVDGALYRKNDDIRLIEMAKRADAAHAAQQQAEIEKREALFAKRGDETLTHFAKGAKGDLRGRIMKALNAEFTVPAEYEEAIGEMKKLNAYVKDAGQHRGFTPDADAAASADPTAKLNMLAKKYETDNKVPFAKAYTAVLQTPEGSALYAQANTPRA